MPNEWAPSHRHTPNAVRLIVEGEGAYTTVEGQKCVMEHGDLILTPSGLWHEHGHDGDQPVIWLDVLEVFAKNHTNLVPVLDENNQYKGYYEIEDIIKFFHETPFLKEQGG